MAGHVENYETIGTVPNLQQLILHIDASYGHYGDLEIEDPLPPMCDTGSLTRLTRLEIGSYMVLKQVRFSILAFGGIYGEAVQDTVRIGSVQFDSVMRRCSPDVSDIRYCC